MSRDLYDDSLNVSWDSSWERDAFREPTFATDYRRRRIPLDARGTVRVHFEPPATAEALAQLRKAGLL